MANRRIRVIWGASEQQPGEWRLGVWGVHERTPGSRIKDVTVSGRGILRWLATLTMAGYLTGAVALFFWLDRRPGNLVGLSDTLLLPIRWQQIQELRGRTYITEGMEDLKARRWADAQMKLRLGLMKYPRDLRARLALSQFYVAIELRPLALTLLREGLDFGYPGRSYLETLIQIANEGEEFGAIISACDRYLTSHPEDHSWLLAQKIQALIGERRAEEALRLAAAQDRPTNNIREGQVMALLDLRRFDEAAAFLQSWRQTARNDLERVLRLQVRTFREQRQVGPMLEALEQLRSLHPSDPRPYVYGIVQLHLAGDAPAATAALERYILRFGASAANLVLLSDPLAETQAMQLLQRVMAEAAAQGFSTKPYKSSLVILCLRRGEPANARRMLDELKPAIVRNSPTEMFWHEWVGQLITAALAPADSPAVGLAGLLQSRPLPMKIFRLSVEILVRCDRLEAARAVLSAAGKNYPASRTLGELGSEIAQTLAARQAKAVIAVTAPEPVQTEKAFFAQLTELEKPGHWAEAAQAIRAVRAAQPAWLDARRTELLQRQMRVAVETADMPELLGAAKPYLDGSNERSQRVVSIARLLYERGSVDHAKLVLAEVFRRSTDFPPARRLRDEMDAAAALKTKK